MTFILKKSGFSFILAVGLFTILFGYQNCGKVKFNREEKVGPVCETGITDLNGACCAPAQVASGENGCGNACAWQGPRNVSASPTTFNGTGTVSGEVTFSIPDNDEIDTVTFDFDDGSPVVTVTGGNQVVNHTFTSSSNRQFRVQAGIKKVGSDQCVHNQTIMIIINTTTNCLISTELSGDNTGVVGEELDFQVGMSNCPNNGYAIDWHKNFNQDQVVDASTVNNPNMVFRYGAPGLYRVRASTTFEGLALTTVSEKDVIISCPFGSYEDTSANICICHSNNQQVPANGVCPSCGTGANQDPTTGTCVCPVGQTYDPVQMRCECPSGNPPNAGGSCQNPQCSVTVNGQTITREEGGVLTLHRRDNAGATTCGFTCSSQSRTCRGGQFVNSANQPQPFDPGYIYSEVVACQSPCGTCSLPVADGTLTANANENRTVHRRATSSSSCGFTCSSEVLTCNGTNFLNSSNQVVSNGSALYINQPQCTSACQRCTVVGHPTITQIDVGQHVSKYTTIGVACTANQCAEQRLTCTTAGQTLLFSSDYTHTDPEVCRNNIPTCPACPVVGYPGRTSVAAGTNLVGYTTTGAPCGGACLEVSRACPATGGTTLTFPAGTYPTPALCNPNVPACSNPPVVIYSKTSGGSASTAFNYNSENIYGRVLNTANGDMGCSSGNVADPSHPSYASPGSSNLSACDNNANYVRIDTHSYASNNTKHWVYSGGVWNLNPSPNNIYTPTSHRLYGHQLIIPGTFRSCAKNAQGERGCTTITVEADAPEIILSRTEGGADVSSFDYQTDSIYMRVNKLAPTIRDYQNIPNYRGCIAADADDPNHPAQNLNYCNVSSPEEAYEGLISSRYIPLPKEDWDCFNATSSQSGRCVYKGLQKIGGGFTNVIRESASAVPGRYKMCIYNKFGNKITCREFRITGTIPVTSCPSGQFLETHRDTGEQFCARAGSVDGQFCSGGTTNTWAAYSNRSNRPDSQFTCPAAAPTEPVDKNYADLWWVHQDRTATMFHRNLGICSGSTACAILANIDVYRASTNTFLYTRNISTAADVQRYLGSTKCTSVQTAFSCARSATCPSCPEGQTWNRSTCQCSGGVTIPSDSIDVFTSTSSSAASTSPVPNGPFSYKQDEEFFSYVKLPSNATSYRVCVGACTSDAQFSTEQVSDPKYTVTTVGNYKVLRTRNAPNSYPVGSYVFHVKYGTASDVITINVTAPTTQTAQYRWERRDRTYGPGSGCHLSSDQGNAQVEVQRGNLIRTGSCPNCDFTMNETNRPCNASTDGETFVVYPSCGGWQSGMEGYSGYRCERTGGSYGEF